MAFTEDFADFTDTDDFAVSATFSGQQINGIFDKEYIDPENIESRQLMFGCAEADVPNVTNQDQITISGTTYNIHNPRPDGTGWITLYLHEA